MSRPSIFFKECASTALACDSFSSYPPHTYVAHGTMETACAGSFFYIPKTMLSSI